jgi:hypothetical protein
MSKGYKRCDFHNAFRELNLSWAHFTLGHACGAHFLCTTRLRCCIPAALESSLSVLTRARRSVRSQPEDTTPTLAILPGSHILVRWLRRFDATLSRIENTLGFAELPELTSYYLSDEESLKKLLLRRLFGFDDRISSKRMSRANDHENADEEADDFEDE